MTTNELVAYAVIAVGDKKGIEIPVIGIFKISVAADYFMLVNGTNQKRTQAIVNETKEKLVKHEVFPRQKEGYSGGTWTLLDYQGAMIHIFNSEDRRFCNLERIWADGITVDPKTFHISEE